MALFHFTVTQTKRSKGQSAIASAAYRSGEKLYSEYYGELTTAIIRGIRRFRQKTGNIQVESICKADTKTNGDVS